MTEAPSPSSNGGAPVVRWDPRKAALVGEDGAHLPTTAQEAKARRYCEGGHVKELGRPVTPEVPWATSYKTIRRYELAPIPGCRQVRRVWVHEHYDDKDRLVAVDFFCDCQRAGGTAATRPTVCSHSLAVHRFRKITKETTP